MNCVKPVNKNATTEAVKLLEYLYEVAGNRLITGQHTQTNPMEEIDYIYELTGKKPKLQGFELLSYSPNINYEDASEACITEIRENEETVDTAIAWAKSTDGIVTLTYHWFSPIGGRDKAFYTEHTDFDASKVLIEGTEERRAFYHDLDELAVILKRFYDEKIPVLWRPFHEADGTWFWWGAKGHEVGRDLYILMFDYLIGHYHLDNLIWVWNSPVRAGYPGDEYVDVISRDVYTDKHKSTDYEAEYKELIANTTDKKVAALAEVGVLPDINLLSSSRIPWAYYMTWSKEFCMTEEYNTKEMFKQIFSSDYAITL